MAELKSNIPYYKDLNDFLKSIPLDFKIKNPNFFCLRHKEKQGSMRKYKPLFRKDFYIIALASDVARQK